MADIPSVFVSFVLRVDVAFIAFPCVCTCLSFHQPATYSTQHIGLAVELYRLLLFGDVGMAFVFRPSIKDGCFSCTKTQ